MEQRPRLGAGPEHWNKIHEARAPDQLTWYQPIPQKSLDLIELAGLRPAQRLVDVGGGSSLLCDRLLDAGYRDITVVDISAASLAYVRSRIDSPADCVTLVESDIGDFRSEREFDLWHDRAVFHFLIEDRERKSYLESLEANLAKDGHLVMATFGLEGPDECSGLPVRRYSPESLEAEFSDSFKSITFLEDLHTTPAAGTQHFLYALFKRSR